MTIETGAKLPDGKLKQMTADGIKDVHVSEFVAGKKVIMFGVPGAYTPVCSTQHLPGYITEYEKLKAEGVGAIACVSVNDPFVMAAWGKEAGADDKVMMLCDADASFTKALGLDLDLGDFGLGTRSKRWSMVVEDGVVTKVNVEASIFDHGTSSASHLLAETV